MPVAKNAIHLRTLSALAGWEANPQLHAFMQPFLREKFLPLALEIRATLALSGTPGDFDYIDDSYERTHHLLGRMHDGLRFNYAEDSTILAQFAPLTVGEPETDLIKLTKIHSELPKVTPAFAWPHDLKLADLKKALDAHQKAKDDEKTLGKTAQEAVKKLRTLRGPAEELWEKEGLQSWILANVRGYEAQLAWGIERRRRPRHDKEEGEKKDEAKKKDAKSRKKDGTDKEKQDSADKAKTDGTDKKPDATPPPEQPPAAKTGTDA